MYEEINLYRKWNTALLDYFFPAGNEDAILYLDENVLAQIAQQSNELYKPNDITWSEYLLSSTLLSGEALNAFAGDWSYYTGTQTSIGRASSWNRLVEELTRLKFSDGTPAYFAMICSIMLLASIAGAHHARIKREAQKYLGQTYSRSVGELIDPLLQQLHKDKPSFNANRMLCGNMRHISRIKYHLVLRKEMRDDFIDFLEVNNLRWGYESYEFFINNILVPALDRAGKHNLVDFVIRQENISYVKNILKSDLCFGRPSAESLYGNSVQTKLIRWKYVLEIDYNGELFFSIQSDYNNTPFNVVMENETFKIDLNNSFSEIIASGVKLCERPSVELMHNDNRYDFCNISEGGCLYFERIYDGYYIQVNEPQVGLAYYCFKPIGVRERIPQNGYVIEYVQYPGYTVYEIPEYQHTNRRVERRTRTEDSYNFVQLGSWISINLAEGSTIYWSPNVVNSQPVRVDYTYRGQDDKTYFRIPPYAEYISGDIIIKDSEDNEVYSEQISHAFEWDGKSATYHMNGWGEITDVPMNSASISNHSRAKLLLQIKNSIQETIGADILIQILYDIADKNGCVSSRKMVAALEFALSFHGVFPTAKNKKSVIYALRRLGYMISYYDVIKREYVNQLLSKYVEKSNYSFNLRTNAYFVKGIYSTEALNQLVHNTGSLFRKRPYEEGVIDRRPEYACLPDLILFELERDSDWTKYDFQISDYMIATMQDMSQFGRKFLDEKNANLFMGVVPQLSPSIIKDAQGREVLCVRKANGSHVTYNYYSADGYLRPIPKHLTRLYVQNKRNMPIGIMNWNRYNKSLDYSKLSFVSGMGVPEVLDIALCDTNLGMPYVDEVFIINQKELGIESNRPVVERRTYSTNATNRNNSHVVELIKKMSAREVAALDGNPDVVYVARNQGGGYYKMFLEKKYACNKDLILLYCQTELLAFSLGSDVYYQDPRAKSYRKVQEKDVNFALSCIYKNQIDCIQLGESLKASVPQLTHDKAIEIPIIERQIF